MRHTATSALLGGLAALLGLHLAGLGDAAAGVPGTIHIQGARST